MYRSECNDCPLAWQCHRLRLRLVKHPRVKHPRAKHPRVKHPRVKHPRVKHPRVKHPRVKHPRVKHPRVKHPQAKHPRVTSLSGTGQVRRCTRPRGPRGGSRGPAGERAPCLRVRGSARGWSHHLLIHHLCFHHWCDMAHHLFHHWCDIDKSLSTSRNPEWVQKSGMGFFPPPVRQPAPQAGAWTGARPAVRNPPGPAFRSVPRPMCWPPV